MKTRLIWIIMAIMISAMTASAQKTDISNRDNVSYGENATATPGEQIILSVQMNNTLAVRGFQFDLLLPDGITVATDEDDFLMVELSTARTTEKKMNYFDTETLEDGSLRVLCNSSKAYTFDGNSGEVCTITVNVASGLGGDFDINLNNVVLTDPDAERYPIDGSQSVISVKEKDCDCGILGDLNKDGKISVADVMLLVKMVLAN